MSSGGSVECGGEVETSWEEVVVMSSEESEEGSNGIRRGKAVRTK